MSLQKTREFILSEKLVSLKDKVWVMDAKKEKLGYFMGKIIKIGNTYRLRDLQDEENPLLTVHEKVVSLRATYTFYKGGEKDDDKLLGRHHQEYEDREEQNGRLHPRPFPQIDEVVVAALLLVPRHQWKRDGGHR